MRINRGFNPRTRVFTSAFPKWSAAYQDPNSDTNRLLNPLVNAIEYMENVTRYVDRNSCLLRVDPDSQSPHRWVIDHRDIGWFDEDVADNRDEYVGVIENMFGMISGEVVRIQEVQTDSPRDLLQTDRTQTALAHDR